ncbi:MAG: hypothetical protein ACK53Y_11665, partial [bacterium]
SGLRNAAHQRRPSAPPAAFHSLPAARHALRRGTGGRLTAPNWEKIYGQWRSPSVPLLPWLW